MTSFDPTEQGAGMRMFKALTRAEWRKQPAGFPFDWFKQHAHILPLVWSNKQPGGIHEYDQHAAYLGAAGGVRLGVGKPELVKAPELSDVAGCWHIIARQGPATPGGDLPPLLMQKAIQKEESWQYTPMVQQLVRMGYQVEIKRALLWPETHQVLRAFYSWCKDQREDAAGDPERLKAVKQLYTSTFGMFAHWPKNGASPSYLYRPDWWYTIVSLHKARLLERMRQVLQADELAPVKVDTDAIYYTAPVSALPIGPGIGQFSHEVIDE